MGDPYNRPCAISTTQTTRVDGGPAGRPRGAPTALPPYLHALPGERRQLKVPHPPRRCGARCRRPPSRLRRRGRACAAAAARHCLRDRAHSRGASVRGAGRGAPDRGPPPHWPTGRPPRARRHCHAGRRPHARTRAASTGGPRRRGRGPPAAGGRVGRALTAAGRHAAGGGGARQRRGRRGRPDGAQARAAMAPPSGRPPSRRSRATADGAAAGRWRGRGGRLCLKWERR